jgi:predicted TIM-barrel fold metal-dependent hydrolase
MIDMHIHVVPPNLEGVGPLSPALKGTLENVARIVRDQMRAAGCQAALAMGSFSHSDEDPLGINRTLKIAENAPGLFPIGIANPERNDPGFLRRVEEDLAAGKVKALKAYLGYVHYYPSDPGYLPYYRLAEKYRLPFIFHTGDTYSPNAKLKFAHPLGVDEVAVDFPKVNFVLAHLGNPWMIDAAEVIYKNMNVWCDLSGLLVGEEADFNEPGYREVHLDAIDRIRKAFRYTERPNRFLHGSDWPLAPIKSYRKFIEQAIPEEFHEMVFVENSQRLFRLEV